MKTHGEKRIRAILEVFHAVHSLRPAWARKSISSCASFHA